MKIDPIYLLAPRPQAKGMPTRRAFLLASGTFVAGTAIGGACGYSMGASGSATAAQQPAAEPDLEKSGDVELDELRRLAVKAPLDELFEKAPLFLHDRVSTYKHDDVLWRGVDRLSKEIIENSGRRVDYAVIGLIINQIEGTARPSSPSLTERVPLLRTRLQEERRRR